MIFDRTSADVLAAKNIRADKVQKFIELTDEDIQVLERGMVTINTLNRIESKQAEIKTILNDMGYFNTPIVNKMWEYNDIFAEADLQRLVDNNASLRRAFYVLSDSPRDAIAKYHYIEFNALEKILVDISENIDFAKSQYRECGAIECGG